MPFTNSPLDGEGARLYGGRWNSKGVALAYTAQNLSLAMLEILVHLEDETSFDLFRGFEVQVPDELIAIPGVTPGLPDLPEGWNLGNSVPARNYGDQWAKSQASVALRVPSAINPRESNVLLNVRHADFPRITVGPAESFTIDARLIKS